jgi:hypothetical protein
MKIQHSFLAILSFILSSVIFISCEKEESKNVNQSRIYTEYELFYDENTNITYASAWFRFSDAVGKQLQLSAPSTIKFNNEALPYDQILNNYRKEYAGKINSGTFVFTDVDGKTYSNQVSLAPAIANPANLEPITKDKSYTYTWVGDALKRNELVSLTIGSGTTIEVFLQVAEGAQQLVLPLTQLNKLLAGTGNCQLDRVAEGNVSQATAVGGKTRGKYRALNKSVEVR